MGLFDFLFGKKRPAAVDLKQLAQAGAIILDVRTLEEFNAAHIKGAKHIPVQVIEQHLEELKALDKQIIAYCRSGRRSGKATRLMVDAGIQAVNGGGFEALKNNLR